MRVVILGSGKGGNAEAILRAQKENRLGTAKVVGILTDMPDAGILKVGELYGVESCYLNPGEFRTKLEGEAEKIYIDKIKSWNPDLVVLAGFLRLVKESFLEAFPNIINIHPSLLPSFKGLHAIKQAWDYGVKVAGCTVHRVSLEVDEGEILGQLPVKVEPQDSLDSLEERVHNAEHALLPSVILHLSKTL